MTLFWHEIKHLIDDSNIGLYSNITKKYPVQLKSGMDEWNSEILKDRVIINFSRSKSLSASFAHELLHVDMQLQGYRKLRSGLSLKPIVHDQLPFLCHLIDNEFQHHKIFPKFVNLGYLSSDFHQDSDSIFVSYIENGLRSKGQSLLSISRVYLNLISPARLASDQKVDHLKSIFRAYDDGSFKEIFDKIDLIMASWKDDSTVIAEPYIIELLKLMGCSSTWIAYVFDASDFPNDGFFAGDRFTIDEINSALR